MLRLLLKNFGLKFQSIPANIVEFFDENVQNYAKLVTNLAYEKAAAVAKKHKGLIIGADTVVVLNQRVLGKPDSRADAVRKLKMLSGKTHEVFTGLAIVSSYSKKIYKAFEVTKVKFRKLMNTEIEFYVKTGSPMDKAGAYGIQDDFGSTFIERIDGDYFNVVGLPLLKTYTGLQKFIKFRA